SMYFAGTFEPRSQPPSWHISAWVSAISARRHDRRILGSRTIYVRSTARLATAYAGASSRAALHNAELCGTIYGFGAPRLLDHPNRAAGAPGPRATHAHRWSIPGSHVARMRVSVCTDND